MPDRFSAIFARFPSLSALAEAMPEVPYDTIASWKFRNSIPAEYHETFAQAAHKLGQNDISVQMLGDILREVLKARLARRQETRAEWKRLQARRNATASSRGLRF